ncbi:MAG: hypothetical protein J6P72_04155 [Firmicutes bacterium]|nr:hypothetical protein [Bacillota bacterium]
MTFLFKSSRIAAGIILALTGVIIGMIWLRSGGKALYIPIVGTILMAGIGYFAARLFANIVSSTENTRRLGYLHIDLDPKKFIASYEKIPEKVHGSDQLTLYSYLADGYWADGQFKKAIETLEKTKPDTPALLGLQASKLAPCYLALGDKAAASHQLDRLSAVIEKTKTSNPPLSKNFLESYTIYRQYLAALNAQEVSVDYLKSAFTKAEYTLRRLEIAQILVMDGLRHHNESETAEKLTYLKEHGGKTFFRSWAISQDKPFA